MGQIQFKPGGSGGSGITDLTGDVTATGPGSAVAVLVNVPAGATGLAAIARSGSASDLIAGTVADARLSSNVALLNAANSFTASQQISNTQPRILFNETDAGAGALLWDFDVQTRVFTLRTRTDADGLGKTALSVTRGAGSTALTAITFGNTTDAIIFRFNASAAGSYIFNAPASFGGGITSTGAMTLSSASAILSVQYGTGIGDSIFGFVTLAAGTAHINYPGASANHAVFLTNMALSGAATPQALSVAQVVNGFDITSASVLDTSKLFYLIVKGF